MGRRADHNKWCDQIGYKQSLDDSINTMKAIIWNSSGKVVTTDQKMKSVK